MIRSNRDLGRLKPRERFLLTFRIDRRWNRLRRERGGAFGRCVCRRGKNLLLADKGLRVFDVRRIVDPIPGQQNLQDGADVTEPHAFAILIAAGVDERLRCGWVHGSARQRNSPGRSTHCRSLAEFFARSMTRSVLAKPQRPKRIRIDQTCHENGASRPTGVMPRTVGTVRSRVGDTWQ